MGGSNFFEAGQVRGLLWEVAVQPLSEIAVVVGLDYLGENSLLPSSIATLSWVSHLLWAIMAASSCCNSRAVKRMPGYPC